jgi:leucyl-tRNA synthetase
MARFLRRLWAQAHRHAAEGRAPALATDALSPAGRTLRRQLHETIQKVGDDYGRRYTFNTAIAAVMELLNALAKYDEASANASALRQEAFEAIVLLLNPITPHASHALWQKLGHAEATLEDIAFPVADPAALVRNSATLAVRVNGKLRGTIEVPVDAAREAIEQAALSEPHVARFLEGMAVRKLIVVPGKIVNIVAG